MGSPPRVARGEPLGTPKVKHRVRRRMATLQMKNGLLVAEVELLGTNPAGDWVFETNEAGYKGSGFYRWAGSDKFGLPNAGNGILKYTFEVKEAGNYFLSLRALRDAGVASDADNDVWMRVDGKGFGANGSSQPWTKMFFSGPNEQWNWTTKFDYSNHTKANSSFSLGVGVHTIEFSGRSSGFHFDRFHLNKGSFNTDPSAGSTGSGGGDPGTNQPPVAAADVIGTSQGKPVTIAVLANDKDGDGDVLTPSLVTKPGNGTVHLTTDKKFVYVADAGFVGQTKFTYSAADGDGGSDSATVTVNVAARQGTPINGTAQNDKLVGTAASETLQGFNGADTIGGNDGADLLFGWAGNDILNGGAGNDVMFGGAGSDTMDGGLGADLFVLAGELGAIDVIKNFNSAAGDRVLLKIPGIQLANGALDGDEVELVAQGANLGILIDPEGDGSFRQIATIQNASGLSEGQVLANAITDAIA